MANLPSKEMVTIGRWIPPDEYTNDVNMTAIFLDFLNKTGDSKGGLKITDAEFNFTSKNVALSQIIWNGGYFFEMISYELDDDKDWSGTILAAAIGIASICTGLLVINLYAASSLFAATIGSSLVMQGVGDLIQSLASIVSSNPIDSSSYITHRGISIGVTLATAGLLQVANMIPAINGMGFLQAGADKILQAASDPTKFLIVAASVQATSAIAGMALQYAGKELINKKDIEAKSSQLAEEMVISNQELLDRIYATDEIIGNGKDELQGELHREIARGIAKYQRRFHDEGTTFATNTATEVVAAVSGMIAWVNAISSAAKSTMGAIKNAEAMGKIEEHTRSAIKKIAKRALGSSSMMQRKLYDEFGKDTGDELFTELYAQGYVENGEIDYKNCGKFKEVKIPTAGLGDVGKRLFAGCTEVANVLKPRSHQEFKAKFISLMSSLVASIQVNEVLGPITGFAAGVVGGKAGTLAGEYFYEQVQEHYREGRLGVVRQNLRNR